MAYRSFREAPRYAAVNQSSSLRSRLSSPPRLYRIQAPGTRGGRGACIRRVTGCAPPTGATLARGPQGGRPGGRGRTGEDPLHLVDFDEWARRTKSLDALFPALYLRGVSTGDFQEVLTTLLVKDAPNL